MVVLTIILVLVTGLIPNGVQWAGLLLSFVAALILTQHDKFIMVWNTLTGRSVPAKKSPQDNVLLYSPRSMV